MGVLATGTTSSGTTDDRKTPRVDDEEPPV
jgi:hypothetical protein